MDSTMSGTVLSHRNEVILVGRLGAPPEERILPSGDVLTTFRVIVERSPGDVPSGGRRSATVDTLDCAAWDGEVRRAVTVCEAGDVILVSGALRRRFWKGPGGPVSRCEIEVRGAERLGPGAGGPASAVDQDPP